MIIRKLTSAILTTIVLVGCITSAVLVALLSVGCSRDIDPRDDGDLDWSKRAAVTLKSVSIASGGATRATGETPMPVGYQFRMYVMAQGSQQILETRTYTIKDQDGVPQMDLGQSPLLLPYGTLDVHLVGPLEHKIPSYTYDDIDGTPVVVPEQITPIAKEDGVTPVQGVDLIASRTQIKVMGSAATAIVANPLEHKMTQIDIVIERFRSELGEAVYENMDMEYISIDNVAVVGDFTFDDNGGTITPSGPLSTVRFDPSKIQATKNVNGQKEKFRVNDYLVPRPAKKSKIEIQFAYNIVGVPDPVANTQRRAFSGLTSELAFTSGVRMQFSSMPVLGVDLVFRPNALPWDDEGNTVIDPPANPELVFWYSGEDAPEDIYGDGKMYWRDRSGNGNHALVVKGLYDAAGKFYYPSPGSDPSFLVPPLWDSPNTDYTLELASQSISATSEKRTLCEGLHAVVFSDKDFNNGEATEETIKIDLPYGNFLFRGGAYNVPVIHFAGGTASAPLDTELFEQFHTYAFARKSGKGYVFVNGNLQTAQEMNYSWRAFNGPNNMMWKPTNLVEPHNKKVRLYGAKMYRTCKVPDNGTETFGAKNEELTRNYVNYVSNLAKVNVTAKEYVKDGLIVDLRAEDITADGATWVDRSGRGNNFVKVGTDIVATAKEKYQFFFDLNSYLKSSKPLGTLENFTVEVVAKSNVSDFSSVCLFSAYESSQFPAVGSTSVWWPNNMKMTANIAGGQMNIPYASLTNGDYNTAASVCFQRNNKEILLWQSGAKPVNVARTFGTVDLQTWNVVTIGSPRNARENYNGWVYALRIYNRALSNAERQHNYLIDKEKYNLLGYKQ